MKKIISLLLLALLPLCASAYEAKIDGIYYIFNTVTRKATVTYYSDSNKNKNAYTGNVNIPASVNYNGVAYTVKEIGAYAFRYCSKLTSVTIPGSMTSIGIEAFSGCSSLASVTIPNSVTSIGGSAFDYCSSLTYAAIGNGVKSIGMNAFNGCIALNSVYISDIDSWCKILFSGEESNPLRYAHHLYLGEEEIKNLVIPNSVTSIGEWAFYCCDLTSVTIGDSVTSVGSHAFQGCNGVTSLTIGNSVTSIGDWAFTGCCMTSVTIPNSVTSIGHLAFFACSGLTSVTIPNTVTSIGREAFRDCHSLKTATIGNGVTILRSGTFYGCSNLTTVTIPNSVTSIENGGHDAYGNYWGVFQGCSRLTSVTIPNSVKSIGDAAFWGCTRLTSINIPNSVTIIGYNAFYECKGLKSVYISDIETWCKISFSDYSNPLFYAHHLFIGEEEIIDLIIPNGMTSIGSHAFEGCSSLASVTIPNSVTSIGNYTFMDCSGLTSVTIPNSVTAIGESAFRDCQNIATLELPDELKIIRESTFKGCNSLKSVTIPATVEFIYQEAFANCYGLENVKALPLTPPFLYDNSFSNYLIPLKVPKGCKEAYQTAQGWKNFTNIRDADKYNLIYFVDNEIYKSYEIEEGVTITLEPIPTKEGYTFSGWSEIPEIMPAHDVTVTGSFIINKYQVTYIIDGEVFATDYVEYGAMIVPPTVDEKEGFTFSGWDDIPETMPAHDIVVYASYTPCTSGIVGVLMASQQKVRIYSHDGKKLDKLQKGLNIVILNDGTVKKILVK